MNNMNKMAAHRLASHLQQTAPPTDPRLRRNVATSSSDQNDGPCRDFVWGICSKGAQCRYQHILTFEVMKKILKFCHDFQNKSGCTRPGCTYLHTSNEEENLFLTTGQIPKILQERYVAMAASTSTNVYLNEIIKQRPPPPPPPLVAPVASTAPPPHLALLPAILAPPPPPPTVSLAPVQTTPPIFTAPPPANATVTPIQTANQPAAEVPMFDASKPPPPIPIVSTSPKNTVKRAADCSTEAGPSKVRKEEGSIIENTPCEKCVQRELRVHIFRKEIQKRECEKECQLYLYNKKLEMFESGKLLLKSAVSPELFRILDDYVESSSPPVSPQVPDVMMSQFNQMSSLVTGSTSSLQRKFLLNMMELARNIVDVGSRSTIFGNDTEVTMQSLLEMIKNANQKPERQSPVENRCSPRNGRSSPLGSSRYLNNANIPVQPFPSIVNSPVTIPSGSALVQAHPPNGAIAQSLSSTHSLNVPTINQGVAQANHNKVLTSQSTNNQLVQSVIQPQNITYGQNTAHSQNVAHLQGATQPQSVPPSHALANSSSQAHQVVHQQGVIHPRNMTASQGIVQPHSVVLPHNGTLPQGGAISQSTQNAAQAQHPPQVQQLAQSQHLPQAQQLAQAQLVPQSQHVPQSQNMPQTHIQQAQHGMQPQNVAHPHNVTPAAVPPTAYMSYQAAVPPPSRPYYHQYPSASNNATNMSYSHVTASATSQSSTRPSNATTTTQNTYPYGMARYPQPHYYSAYQ